MFTHRERWLDRFLVLLVVPAIGFASLLEPFGRDQGIHATIAYALESGLVTYRDVFNIKPPLTTAVHWLSQQLFGHSMLSIRALDLIFVSLGALGLMEIGRLLGRSRVFGASAAVGFALLYYSYGYWEHAQTDGWAGLTVIATLWLLLLAWRLEDSGSRRALVCCAGMALGVGFCLKYTIGGAGILVFAPLIAVKLGGREAQFLVSDLVMLCLGGLGVLLSVLGLMYWHEALDPFLSIQSFISGYVGHLEQEPIGLIDEFLLIGLHSQYLVIFCALGLVAGIYDCFKSGRCLLFILFSLWVFSAWLSGHIQGKGFGYHFLPMLAPYALLIGAALELMSRKLRTSIQRQSIVILALIALYLPSHAATQASIAIRAMQQADPLAYFAAQTPSGVDFDPSAVMSFAERIQANREQGDSFFLWGYSTHIYFLIEEPPHYYYAYSWPFIVGYYDGRFDQDLLDRLRSSPPTHFVVEDRDSTPWATQNERSSEEMLEDFPELNQFLMSNYRILELSDRYSLYERVTTGSN